MQAKEQTQISTKVKPLGELLEYQDSSIVSRVLLKNNGGTVTLFAFDQDKRFKDTLVLRLSFAFAFCLCLFRLIRGLPACRRGLLAFLF